MIRALLVAVTFAAVGTFAASAARADDHWHGGYHGGHNHGFVSFNYGQPYGGYGYYARPYYPSCGYYPAYPAYPVYRPYYGGCGYGGYGGYGYPAYGSGISFGFRF